MPGEIIGGITFGVLTLATSLSVVLTCSGAVVACAGRIAVCSRSGRTPSANVIDR
ncbi:MAG: hypothetical protein O3C10_03905 [Chloroflexi bacterium]|nr:hypothetical protein [Chloroflexota bacterium]